MKTVILHAFKWRPWHMKSWHKLKNYWKQLFFTAFKWYSWHMKSMQKLHQSTPPMYRKWTTHSNTVPDNVSRLTKMWNWKKNSFTSLLPNLCHAINTLYENGLYEHRSFIINKFSSASLQTKAHIVWTNPETKGNITVL